MGSNIVEDEGDDDDNDNDDDEIGKDCTDDDDDDDDFLTSTLSSLSLWTMTGSTETSVKSAYVDI